MNEQGSSSFSVWNQATKPAEASPPAEAPRAELARAVDGRPPIGARVKVKRVIAFERSAEFDPSKAEHRARAAELVGVGPFSADVIGHEAAADGSPAIVVRVAYPRQGSSDEQIRGSGAPSAGDWVLA